MLSVASINLLVILNVGKGRALRPMSLIAGNYFLRTLLG